MVKIIADRTCDLSEELLRKYDISILPLHILLGEQECEDRVDILKPYVEDGLEVVCFSISDEMSASGNVMRLAANELEAEELVTVINSANLSTGIGLLVIEAAIMAGEGKSAKEIVQKIQELRSLVRASFIVNTLTYLHRGGRCRSCRRIAEGYKSVR